MFAFQENETLTKDDIGKVFRLYDRVIASVEHQQTCSPQQHASKHCSIILFDFDNAMAAMPCFFLTLRILKYKCI